MDEESTKGRFGWKELGSLFFPYIFRSGEKYCAQNMVQRILLERNPKFCKIGDAVLNCVRIQTHYISAAELRLLNDINFKHCDSIFGSAVCSDRAVILRLDDVQEFYEFLTFCHSTVISKQTNPKLRCGYFKINSTSVIPYTVKNDRIKYVSCGQFVGVFETLGSHIIELDGWELSYLKFCYLIQGVRGDFRQRKLNQGIDINVLKTVLPQDYTYEEYWPEEQFLQIAPNDSEPKSDWWIKPKTPALINGVVYPLTLTSRITIPQPIEKKQRTQRTPITLRPTRPQSILPKKPPSDQFYLEKEGKRVINLHPGLARVNTLETSTNLDEVQIRKARIYNKFVVGIVVPQYGFLVPLNNLITLTGFPVTLSDCLKVVTELSILKYNGSNGLLNILKKYNGISKQMNEQNLIMVAGEDIAKCIKQIEYMFSGLASRANCQTPNNSKRQRIT